MSIRNYNAFLREVKKKHGVSHSKAQAAYRATRDRLGRSAKGSDVKKHPRIVATAVKAGSARNNRKVKGSRKHSPVGQKRIIETIAEWRMAYMNRGGDTVRIVSSADYGRKRGRR